MFDVSQITPDPGFDALDVAALLSRRTLKWSRYGPDVLAAWVAEMDVPTAPAVLLALRAAVDREDLGYPQPDELTGLQAATAAFLADAHGWTVDPDAVRVVGDVLRGVEVAIGRLGPPGGAVVLPTPAYPPFFPLVRRIGRVFEVPLVAAGGRLVLDLDAIDGALAATPATVLLCNPHNPTGTVHPRAALAALAEVVERRGGRVVADEVHAPLTYPGARHVPYASVSPAAAEHTVTVTSASKGWNLPGVKCAQVVLGSPRDAARWERDVPSFDRLSASPLGIAANLAAYTEGRAWLAGVVDYLDGNRTLLAELLAARLPSVGFRMPAATYLSWLDCRPLGLADPARVFLERGRVAVSDGAEFGAVGRGFVRVNFGTSRTLLARIVDGLARSVIDPRGT